MRNPRYERRPAEAGASPRRVPAEVPAVPVIMAAALGPIHAGPWAARYHIETQTKWIGDQEWNQVESGMGCRLAKEVRHAHGARLNLETPPLSESTIEKTPTGPGENGLETVTKRLTYQPSPPGSGVVKVNYRTWIQTTGPTGAKQAGYAGSPPTATWI